MGFYDGQLKRKTDFNWPGRQETYQTSDGSNGFGLYDMSGNIWQWCHDWYNRDYYRTSPYKNPPGPETASPMPDGKPYRVMRGGNWFNGDKSDPGHGRVSNRDPGYFGGPQDPNHPYYHVGFRVVRPAPALSLVSAASYDGASVAPASIVSAFGSGLADSVVTVKDSAGVARSAQVLIALENQLNFVVPEVTATGAAKISILNGNQLAAGALVMVEKVAPAIFSANASGKGVAAALAERIGPGGTQSTAAVFQCSQTAGSCSGVPIDLSAADEQVVLSLFGTGMRCGSGRATATIGGTAVNVTGPIAQPQYAGLDQVNLGPLPRTLAARGEVDILLTIAGKKANAGTVNIK